MELIRPFEQLSRGDLPLAGGKGANLGAMVQAGLPVPAGFVVLTHAYRAFVAQAGIQAEIEHLAAKADPDSQQSLDAASAQIRTLFDQNPVPTSIAEAITEAYTRLGGGAVAVRSSATAEDLPDASFAGQQETYLNINGADQVVLAVRRCWSSLWTGRALAYRVRNGIAPDDVALAAVVQRLVAADVAGVLFTADPVSGHRGRMVIDGAWGLGESVVSGIVSPDNWVADGATGAILREQIATKTVMTVRTEDGTHEVPVPADLQQKPVLNATQVTALVDLGRRTAAYFGAPQDMEWAMTGGELSLLQSRPITTLFPVPEPAPAPEAGLRIYATLQGMQGVMEPISPTTLSVFRSLATSAPAFLGLNPAVGGTAFVKTAASRIYLDVTGLLSFAPVRKALSGDAIDSAMGRAISDLLSRAEGRVEPATEGGLPVRYVRKGLILTVVRRVLWAMTNPDRVREKTWSTVEAYIKGLEEASRRTKSMAERVQFIHSAVGSALGGIVIRTVPVWVASSVALNMVKRKLAAWGLDPSPLEAVGRSIPHNPTTEMDLALWRLSRTLKAEGAAPRADHPAVQAWLKQYGHRAVREIDIAIPRWREEPEHILHVLSSYMEQDSGATDPESRFAKGAVEADAAVAGITETVRREKGAGRAALVRMLLRRYRKLAGVREWHKFFVVHVFSLIRQVLSEAGAELVKAGRLDQVDDVFFLDFTDLTPDQDLRSLAARNRSEYARELKRRTVPLAITSEGEVSYGVPAGKEGTLTGTGASAGTHEGIVRVILNPVGARLEPGEVLVAPGTDPAWTPLFLTAGALVTETGGMISHGSVVAREYGIPAVVGVQEATTLLRTGQRVRVDGSTGTVVVVE